MTTANLSLPELAAAQADKYLTVNEALAILDVALNLVVIRVDLTTPPGSPSEGDAYIPAATATGDWASQENKVAVYSSSAWIFFNPQEGWRAYDQNANAFLKYSGSAWVDFFAADFPTFAESGDIEQLGINTTPDATSRLAVKADAMLFDHDTAGDMIFSLNKNAAGDDVGIALKTNWASTCMIGAFGDSNLVLKVGTSYKEAMTVSGSTGVVNFPANPRFQIYGISGDQTITADAWATVDLAYTDFDVTSSVDLTNNRIDAPCDGYYAVQAVVLYKIISTAPTSFKIGFSVNGATPETYHTASFGSSLATDDSLTLASLIWLDQGDTLELKVYYGTNNAYVQGLSSGFSGSLA